MRNLFRYDAGDSAGECITKYKKYCCYGLTVVIVSVVIVFIVVYVSAVVLLLLLHL